MVGLCGVFVTWLWLVCGLTLLLVLGGVCCCFDLLVLLAYCVMGWLRDAFFRVWFACCRLAYYVVCVWFGFGWNTGLGVQLPVFWVVGVYCDFVWLLDVLDCGLVFCVHNWFGVAVGCSLCCMILMLMFLFV